MAEEVEKRAKVAWSDDLSHDSEEEREKERVAQLERELAETPIKPIYEPDELVTLVGYIMRITTLYDLRDEDWTDEAKQGIVDWICEPKDLILCIFFKGEKLKAISDIPLAPVFDLTYFSRAPDFVFKADTFHDDIVFGTFVDSVESNMIQMLEFVYAPYFFAINTWPDSVKSEFCSQIHTFLAKLTDMYYKMLGLTVLYIPREGQQLTFEKASADRELVKRLEGVVVYWTHQIKSCLEDQAFVASQKELLCPIRHITKILVTTHSTFIHQFQFLCDEIVQKVDEATSNIEFLQVIRQPCAILECVVDPDEISTHVPEIINLFRFIWQESPYYNTEARITNLFKALSNQIIILCKIYIKLESLFDGQTKKAMLEFSKCIDCCKKYREIYDVMVEAHSEAKPGSWELDTGIEEIEKINKPMFSGARGDQFEAKCEQIEHMFHDALDQVRQVSHTILDVQTPSWYDDVLQFRTVVKDIEVFEGVNHVEEAVVALYSLNNYSKRKNLRRIFKRKTAEVWAMFSDEVQEAKKDMVASRSQGPAELPSFAGRAI
ncbi:putative 1-beta dynein, partial [Operophtera brumata]